MHDWENYIFKKSNRISYWHASPFFSSAWGENLVLMVETVVLVLLLLSYHNRPISAVCFMLCYTLIMLTIIIPLVPLRFITYLNILSIPVLSISRVRICCKREITLTECFCILTQTVANNKIKHKFGTIIKIVYTCNKHMLKYSPNILTSIC